MEEDLFIEPIQSVVPEQRIQPLNNTVSRKYWHIICKYSMHHQGLKWWFPLDYHP